jgi:hypothetical protein
MSIRLDLTDPADRARLANLADKLKQGALEALLSQAEFMRDMAKLYVPIDTGSLQASIRVERRGYRIRVRAGGYITNPKTGRLVDYARIVEGKQPYMGPAWDIVRPNIVELIKVLASVRANE